MSSPTLHRFTVASLCLATSFIALSANAEVILSGSVFPNVAATPTTANQINVGYFTAGTLEINANSTGNGFTAVTTTYSGSVGAVVGSADGISGSLTITGNGSAGSASLSAPGMVSAGINGGTGTITVQNGGRLEVTGTGNGIQAGNSNSDGTIIVDGANTVVRSAARVQIGAYDGSTGSLTISNGARFTAGTNIGVMDGMLEVGDGENSTGTVTVTGANSLLETNGMIIGGSSSASAFTNSGSLTISNGGVATATAPLACTFCGPVYIGSKDGSQVTVTGVNSALNVDAITAATSIVAGKEIVIGGFGTGTLLVENQGKVNAAGANILVGGGSSGTNTDPGTLTVRSGGTVTAGNVLVREGGTLNGNGGIINANVTLQGGTLAPGASPGVMDINGNLLMTSGLLQLEIGTTLSDLINVSGAVTFGSALAIDLVLGITPTSGQVINLASFFAGYTSLVFDPAFDLEAQLNIVGLSSSDYITVALGGETVTYGQQPQQPPTGQVPEPATMLLFGAGLLGLGAIRRRRAA